MVQLLSLIVLKQSGQREKAPFILSSTFSLDRFGFFQRGSVQEVCVFVSREVAQRSGAGQMLSVKHLNYTCHIRVTQDGLAGTTTFDRQLRIIHDQLSLIGVPRVIFLSVKS